MTGAKRRMSMVELGFWIQQLARTTCTPGIQHDHALDAQGLYSLQGEWARLTKEKANPDVGPSA
jgi:hypothetical protein